MSADDLAAELLTAALDADPLAGSLYGFPGYDNLLPDFGTEAEAAQARTLESIAQRSAETTTDGLEESELQTLDFVRCMARGMADAATVPAHRVHHLRHVRCAGGRRLQRIAEAAARHRRTARGLPHPDAPHAVAARDRRAAPPRRRSRRPDCSGPAGRIRHRPARRVARRPRARRDRPTRPRGRDVRSVARRRWSQKSSVLPSAPIATHCATTFFPTLATTNTPASASSPVAIRCTGSSPGCTPP